MTDETSEKSESTAGGSRAAQSVRDVVERTFLAGMGAAALTKDRVQDLIEDLVHLGQINAEEGRDMVDRLLDAHARRRRYGAEARRLVLAERQSRAGADPAAATRGPGVAHTPAGASHPVARGPGRWQGRGELRPGLSRTDD